MRSDRLYKLITELRDGRLHRAADLARKMNVSERTIYRDMETLAASGVPVQGERGVGYWVTAAITLPPLNLSLTELEALHVGLQVVGEAADADLSDAAKTLSQKIDQVLPEERTSAPASWGFAIYPFADAARGFQHLPTLRQAIRSRQKLELSYDGTQMTARPLQLDYWGRVWTCVVWNETAADFAELRADLIDAARILPSLFVEEQGKTLADYTNRRVTL
ncbi:YafY family protein [Nereida sp. MMG025]|uniref:helix-turn-helix transcriptional regulator n=1 Tax=Nereida sp. MMG025 TaxID=2909981 RepID=UPI001F19D574|nr:HTH domain-containing protein [Nereida sp. MMG025]MCF6445324.1 HTH domain-containing protein [Nereida sp. MMG025]